MVKRAMAGEYKMATNYFGGNQQSSLTGPTTLLLSIFTNYARPNQVLFLLRSFSPPFFHHPRPPLRQLLTSPFRLRRCICPRFGLLGLVTTTSLAASTFRLP